MKETHPSLLICDVNDTMLVNEEKLDALRDSIPNICVLGEVQHSDMEGKEGGEVIDFEEGEISDSDSIKKNGSKVCPFFQRGTCFYKSHCQFRHISHKVYNMFEPISSHEKTLKVVSPRLFPSEIENPLNLREGNKNAWEKGLENAKAMIQKSISKRTDDKDFENKKMYISSNSSELNISQEKSSVLKTIEKSELNTYHNTKPLDSNYLRYDKTVKGSASLYKSNCYNVRKSNHEHKWVDPWMRSRSPRKRKNYQSCARKDYGHELSRSSSSSSIENTYQGSAGYKFYKWKSTASPLNINGRSRCYSKSSSRSCSSQRSCSCSSSRSRSSSDSFHSRYRKPIKKSIWYKLSSVPKRTPKKRRSTSLEKWFKHEHQSVSASQSLSPSNIYLNHKSADSISSRNSDIESCGSMTVSSMTCSHSSSSSGSPNSPINYSKSIIKNKISKATKNAIETNNCIQSKKSPITHTRSRSAPKKSTLCKNPTGKLSETFVARNSSSGVINKDPSSQHVTTPEPDLKLCLKPPLRKESTKDHFSSTVNTLLRYRSISNSFKSNQATVSKSKEPVANPSTTSQTLQSSKTSQTPDKKKALGFLPKRAITLNLLPKSRKLMKLSEVANKNKDQRVTLCNVEETPLSKREILLKQLKLIEDAIARKRVS